MRAYKVNHNKKNQLPCKAVMGGFFAMQFDWCLLPAMQHASVVLLALLAPVACVTCLLPALCM
jgi:hypothetical protein